MSEKEFIIQAQKMGYSDEFIKETIENHNNNEYTLPYEDYLTEVIDNYPDSNDP